MRRSAGIVFTDDVRVAAAVDHLAVPVGSPIGAGCTVRVPRLVLRVGGLGFARSRESAGRGVAPLAGEGVLGALGACLCGRPGVAVPRLEPGLASA